MNNPILTSTILLSFFFGTFFMSNPQQKGAVKPDQMNKRDTLLCVEWKLLSTETFGVVKNAGEKQKDDMASFGFDHKAKIVNDGETKTGTWSADKGKNYLTFAVDGSPQKIVFRVMRLFADSLKLEYKDSSLVKTYYVYLKAK